MSEKRFTWKTEKLQHSDDEVLLVVDNENKDWKGHILNIVDLLNEQQEKIEHLEECNHMLGQDLLQSFDKRLELMKENEKLKYINDQLEERLENSGIGVALKMDCEKDE